MVEFKSLRKGQGYKGPEYAGCCNTGARALIYKPKSNGNHKFIVAVEMDMQEAVTKNLFVANANKRVIKLSSGRKAYYFDKIKSAKKKFAELVKLVTDFNEGEQKKSQAYNDAVKKHGAVSPQALEAALALG